MEHTHLDKVLEKLNKDYEDIFNFQTREEKGQLHIFDKNEEYTINHEEDLNSLMEEVNSDSGLCKYEMKDTILPQIEEAVKLDFGKDSYIEWEDSVVMTVAL